MSFWTSNVEIKEQGFRVRQSKITGAKGRNHWEFAKCYWRVDEIATFLCKQQKVFIF